MKFSTCIVREPCAEMVGGLSGAGLGLPDYALAMEQHRAYVTTLKKCGCNVKILPADSGHPVSQRSVKD